MDKYYSDREEFQFELDRQNRVSFRGGYKTKLYEWTQRKFSDGTFEYLYGGVQFRTIKSKTEVLQEIIRKWQRNFECASSENEERDFFAYFVGKQHLSKVRYLNLSEALKINQKRLDAIAGLQTLLECSSR